jgi:hypothetical protein
VKKLTLSIRGDLAERAKTRARRLGSLSAVFEDFLGSFDGEHIADSLCRELGLNCDDALLAPGEVASRRPKALGGPAAEVVAELRRGRAGLL